MKKTIQRKVRSILTITMLLAALGGTVFVIVHAGGLAIRPVAKISGDLMITDESGARQAVVSANVDYLQSTKEGTAHLAIRRDGVRIVAINARINADTQEQAAAAVSALVLRLTNRSGREGVQCSDINERGGLQCADIKFEGDHRVLTEQADQIIDWWDAHARLTHPEYSSPKPTLQGLGKLQLNLWKNDVSEVFHINRWDTSYAVLFFDPADASKIVGGHVRTNNIGVFCDRFKVVSGTLTDDSSSDAPGDFILQFDAKDTGGHDVTFTAVLAIDMLADGTIDVRGLTGEWPDSPERCGGGLTAEGTGNTKFVVPGP